MQTEGAVKQVMRWVALGALFLVPFMPLIVGDSFFFPFITGKAFFFRITVEFAVVAWVVLAFIDRSYRPRASLIGKIVLGFVLWMFIADVFAINATKAFWSNFERMEGWILLAHLLGFFLAASAVLRVEGKWRAWFLTSLAVSVIIIGHAFLQLIGSAPIHQGATRIDASFGNSTYLAIYLFFNVFIALWLALTERRAWLKWSLLALASAESIFLFFTETRSTAIGLIGALVLALSLMTFTAGRRVRQFAILGLVLLALIIGTLYLARESSLVQNNRALQRITSISLADGATRFTIWSMAVRGVLERPLTGWGQEGFNYVFSKYYEPSLHHQEPWFDRAHNAFIDWLVAGGVPAFILYLSLFGSAFVLLWRSPELSRPERIALTAALFGYAIHNLFVFDNLYSYVYFLAILALIDSQVARPIKRFEHALELDPADSTVSALPVAIVALIALVWYANVPGIRTATTLITAMSPSPSGIEANVATFKEVVANPAFAAQEVREQLIAFASSVVQSPQVSVEVKQEVASLAASEMQKQVDTYPLDVREHLQLSLLYRVIGDGATALTHVEAALTLSPKKQAIWIEKGAIEWDMGNIQAARASFTAAYELAPQFSDVAEYAAAGNIAAGDIAASDAILQASFGTTVVDSNVLALAYYRVQNWPRLVELWKLRTSKPNATAQTWFALAGVYQAAGDTASAVETIKTATTLFPEAASAAAEAIAQIRGGAAEQ